MVSNAAAFIFRYYPLVFFQKNGYNFEVHKLCVLCVVVVVVIQIVCVCHSNCVTFKCINHIYHSEGLGDTGLGLD